jgi:hypothetical protein
MSVIKCGIGTIGAMRRRGGVQWFEWNTFRRLKLFNRWQLWVGRGAFPVAIKMGYHSRGVAFSRFAIIQDQS